MGAIDSGTIDTFTACVFANFLQLFLEVLKVLVDFLTGLLELVHGVGERHHRRIVTATPYRPAQVANVGNGREKTPMEMFDDITGAFFRVRQLLPQSHAARGPLDHSNASASFCDA